MSDSLKSIPKPSPFGTVRRADDGLANQTIPLPDQREENPSDNDPWDSSRRLGTLTPRKPKRVRYIPLE